MKVIIIPAADVLGTYYMENLYIFYLTKQYPNKLMM
jgi:hypothetical protein